MNKTKTILYRNAFVGPHVATQFLLDEQIVPTLDEPQYQEWADCLADAPRALRVEVAETVFRHARQDSHALPLFLACAHRSAQRIAVRTFEKSFIRPSDFTLDLLYDGAIDGALRMFQHDEDVADFPPGFFIAMKQGAMRGAFHGRMKKALLKSFPVRNRSLRPRIENQLTAKNMLERIANLPPEPDTARLYRFLQCVIEIGPNDVLKVFRCGSTRLEIDFEPVMKQLGISIWAARQYLSQARQMLKAEFDPDGTFFVEHPERSAKR